jgi:hypothetical protein
MPQGGGVGGAGGGEGTGGGAGGVGAGEGGAGCKGGDGGGDVLRINGGGGDSHEVSSELWLGGQEGERWRAFDAAARSIFHR